MCEDVARTVHIARQLGTPCRAARGRRRPPLRALPERLRAGAGHDQHARSRRSGSSPAASTCTGRRPCDQVAEQSAQIQRTLTGRRRAVRRDRAASRCSPRPPRSGRVMLEANADPDCIGVIAWMHTFSPAKMWITGLDALRKPLLHLHTQLNEALPWASIDMDFMNLNQAAHGDREFGYIQTRLGVARKTVAGHASDPALVGPDRRLDPGRAPAATTCDGLRLARFGDNMRDVAVTEGDKVEAELRFGVSVNTYGVNDLVARGRRGRRRRRGRAGRRVRRHLPAGAGAAPRRRPARVAALRRADRGRAAGVPRRRRLRRVHHELPGPRRAAPAARAGRAAADGRRLRLRRRGRLEDLRAAGRGQGDGRRHRSAAPPSWRTTPTTSGRASRRSSARTCSRSARASPPATPSCEIHPLGIGDREDPVRLVFDAAPGAGRGDRHGRHGRPVPAGGQRGSRWCAPDEPLPNLPVARAVWKPAPSLSTSAECWLTAGGPHHTVLTQAVGAGDPARLRRDGRAPNCW